MKKLYLLVIPLLCLACQSSEDGFDASGVFEATEIVVSSEANGVIREFNYDEGDQIEKGDTVVRIDVTDLELQREQVEATIDAIGQKQNNAGPQVRILEEQLKAAKTNIATLETQLDVLVTEQERVHKLFQSDAATSQQKDEIDGKVEVMQKQIVSSRANIEVITSQIASARSQVAIQNRGITSERKPLQKQISQIDYRVQKSKIANPVKGTLLTKYAYTGEFVNIGKPLYRIGNLSEMELRAYIDGDQLSQVVIGDEVSVYIDKDEDTYHKYSGIVSWVSDKAEFTPKSIQMKDERANLVYAMKVRVVNDGKIKIGMYGEIAFDKENEEE